MTAAAVPAEPQQPAEPERAAERHLSAVPDLEPADEPEHIVRGYN